MEEIGKKLENFSLYVNFFTIRCVPSIRHPTRPLYYRYKTIKGDKKLKNLSRMSYTKKIKSVQRMDPRRNYIMKNFNQVLNNSTLNAIEEIPTFIHPITVAEIIRICSHIQPISYEAEYVEALKEMDTETDENSYANVAGVFCMSYEPNLDRVEYAVTRYINARAAYHYYTEDTPEALEEGLKELIPQIFQELFTEAEYLKFKQYESECMRYENIEVLDAVYMPIFKAINETPYVLD